MTASAPLHLQIRVRRDTSTVMGPGRADLLALIGATGSIAAAARRMDMSYKRAWALVEAMNVAFAVPLVETAKGGAGGGGARLTASGICLLAAYRKLEEDALQSAAAALDILAAALAPDEVPPPPKTA